MNASSSRHPLPMRGLRADNLLAYLAALGTLRTLAIHRPHVDPRLAWRLADGTWQPLLLLSEAHSEKDAASWLFADLQGMDAAPQFVMSLDANAPSDNLTIPGNVFHQIALLAAKHATPDDRAWADFCAAYGTEAYTLDDIIEDTALRTMSGAGHQHFLGSIRALAQRPESTGESKTRKKQNGAESVSPGEGTTVEQFERALFRPWDYRDAGPAMRWDPRDDRRYALRADDPSGSRFDPIRTMRGANRLAVEALPFFPVLPGEKTGHTIGFLQAKGPAVIICPVWTASLALDSVRLLLHHQFLQDPLRHRKELSAHGVNEVYAAVRVNVGRMVNFAPGKPLWGTMNVPDPAKPTAPKELAMT